jgi:hypothetical protein
VHFSSLTVFLSDPLLFVFLFEHVEFDTKSMQVNNCMYPVTAFAAIYMVSMHAGRTDIQACHIMPQGCNGVQLLVCCGATGRVADRWLGNAERIAIEQLSHLSTAAQQNQ